MNHKLRYSLFSVLFVATLLTGCRDKQTHSNEPLPEIILSIDQTEPSSAIVPSISTDTTPEESLSQANTAAEATEEDSSVAVTEVPAEAKDWVSSLRIAQNTGQILLVSATGNTATVSLHTKSADGSWSELLSSDAHIGKNGIGKTKEGDGKTPRGIYHFLFAFGSQKDPGCALSYTQVDNSFFWVDDSSSSYYNQFVSTRSVSPDWHSAENLMAAGSSYRYVLATDYNSDHIPGAGSAIFLHCLPTGGAGCIAVPEDTMKQILLNVQPECTLIIDTPEAIQNY